MTTKKVVSISGNNRVLPQQKLDSRSELKTSQWYRHCSRFLRFSSENVDSMAWPL